MKVKIEIKHYLTGAILFEFEKENNTLRDTVLEAIKKSANLRFADLRSADLSFADLRSADLSFANLRSADLRSADLSFANLRSADLSFANLRSANLSFANLRFANLRSADLSFADLRFANLSFAKNLDGDRTDFWWHIHHEILVEYLTEPIRARINYIKAEKGKNETKEQVDLRLKLLRPVLGKIPNTQKGWEKLHKQECKNCPWDGHTIFAK